HQDHFRRRKTTSQIRRILILCRGVDTPMACGGNRGGARGGASSGLLVIRPLLISEVKRASQWFRCSDYGLFVTAGTRAPGSKTALWRQHAFEAITSDIVAGQRPGPDAPTQWAPLLRRLIEASRAPVEGPSWWTPT